MQILETITPGILGYLRSQRPLVHCITNYVTANDVANTVLGIGASVIMADAKEETAEIAELSDALVLNMGTPDKERILAMTEAGKAANKKGIPVILDPVGVGASVFRNQAFIQILSQVTVTVIRGNLSELSYAAGVGRASMGVDSAMENAVNSAEQVAVQVAQKYNCMTVITGAADVISDGNRVGRIQNGTPWMSAITGAGCMSDGMLGAFLAAAYRKNKQEKENLDIRTLYWKAVTAAVAVMGIAGECALEQSAGKGTGSFRTALLDAVSQMTDEQLAAQLVYSEE